MKIEKIEVYSPTIRRKEMDAVLTAMVEDRIGPGERTRVLIQTAKEQIHFDYAIALRSPAVALHLALKALDVKRRDAVIISALSPRYYLQVLQDLDLVPLYCDVTYDFPCLNKDLIESVIANKNEGLNVCAIVLHHSLGFAPDTTAISELGIPVIEDISQSYGSFLTKEINEQKKNGNEGVSESQVSNESAVRFNSQFCILGLEERDMLTAGGGALLFSMNRRDAAVLRNLEDLPAEYGLPDMNAAMAVVQFRELSKNLVKRREIARLYTQSALRTRHKMFISPDGIEYNNYAFPLVLEKGMKDVKAYARKKDIAIESAFDNTLVGMVSQEQCPEACSLSLRTVLFPLYPRLGMTDAGKVAKLILTLP